MNKKIAFSGLAAAALVIGLPVVGLSQEEPAGEVMGPVAPPELVAAEAAPAEVIEGDTCPLDSPFGCMFGSLMMANPMDPSTWYDGSDGMDIDPSTLVTNPMDPAFMMQIPNSTTHTPFHMFMANPENWAQFMTPEAIMAMMNPEALVKWADAESYSQMMDLQTYAYWAQPGAYMHAMDPGMYTKLIDPAAYLAMFKTVVTYWAELAETS